MKKLTVLFCVLTVFYLVKFEGYTWDPCSYSPNGYGTCLAINCPSGGCTVAEEINVCTDKDCIKNLLNKRGTEHLEGVYEVQVFRDVKQTFINKLEVLKSYDIR